MIRTPPLQRERPAPPVPKRQTGRPRSHTEVIEQTPCPTRARETNRSTSKPKDTKIRNNEKYGTVVARTPLSSPSTATPAIDPTPPKITTEYDGVETPIPETPLKNLDQETPIPETPPQSTEQGIMEENKTRLVELLELLETVTEDLDKINHRQVNTTI